MLSQEQSFCKLPIDVVIDICETTIKDIRAEREKRNKKMIQKEIEKNLGRKQFWASIFKKIAKPMTEEEADKALREKEYFMTSYPSMYAWGALSTSEKILGLAKKAKDNGTETFALTVEDYDYIK